MSESYMRGVVIKALKPLDAVAIENRVYPGTPDLNYIDGWIELKSLPRWPKKDDSLVLVPHYTPQQRLWIKRRALAGGKVFVLMKIARDWLIFKYPETNKIGKVSKKELINMSKKVWYNKLNREELLKCVS